MGDPGPDHQNMLTGTASTEASAIPAMSHAEATHSAEFSGSILHDLLNSIQTFAGQGAGPAEEHRRPDQTQRRSDVRGVRSLQARLPTLYSGNSSDESIPDLNSRHWPLESNTADIAIIVPGKQLGTVNHDSNFPGDMKHLCVADCAEVELT